MIPYRPIRLDTPCDGACLHCPERRTSVAHESDESAFDGPIEATYFALTGGNPLLWSGFEKLVGRLCSAGATHIRVRTNGMSLASGEETDRFVSLGVRIWELKIWAADAALHDRLAGRPGAFDALIQATRRLIEYPLPDADPLGPFVAWETLVVPDNLDQLIPILDLAKSERVERLLFRRHPGLPLRDSTIQPVLQALEHSLQREICAMTRKFPLCLLGEAFAHGEELYSPPGSTGLWDACTGAGECALRPNGCPGWPSDAEASLAPHPINPEEEQGRDLRAFLQEDSELLSSLHNEEAGHSTP